MTDSPIPAFSAACKNYFGLLPGQTLKDFVQETKKLTQKDKEEIYQGFVQLGIPCQPPTPVV